MGTPRLILARVQNLPEGSKYVAIMSAPDDDAGRVEPDPEELAVYERMVWTIDRRLAAQQINAINTLIRTLMAVNGAEAPEIPLVGPSEWSDEGSGSKATQPSLAEVLSIFGAG